MQRLFIILLSPLFLLSCSSKDKDIVIASFNGNELFLSDITDDIPDEIEDSAYFAEKFMNDWIRKELMISYAEMNLNTDQLKYEEQIEDYRASLLIYAYQQELLNQYFDTAIDFSQIEKYYEQYKEEFRLSKNIFKGRFIIVDRSAPNLSNLDRLYNSEDESDVKELEDYCQQFSKEYYLGYNNWQYFSVFNYKLPKMIDNDEYFLRNTKRVFFEDDTYRYYVYIRDYKIEGGISPLAFEANRIKDLLLNKRKIEYLNKLEDDLYQNALAKKQIRIY